VLPLQYARSELADRRDPFVVGEYSSWFLVMVKCSTKLISYF
jgi:hypothetical protein